MANHQADIVAVGFQEVVPLNAGNVVMGMHCHAATRASVVMHACYALQEMVSHCGG